MFRASCTHYLFVNCLFFFASHVSRSSPSLFLRSCILLSSLLNCTYEKLSSSLNFLFFAEIAVYLHYYHLVLEFDSTLSPASYLSLRSINHFPPYSPHPSAQQKHSRPPKISFGTARCFSRSLPFPFSFSAPHRTITGRGRDKKKKGSGSGSGLSCSVGALVLAVESWKSRVTWVAVVDVLKSDYMSLVEFPDCLLSRRRIHKSLLAS